MATTMPMLAPDGTSGEIPVSKASQAMAAGFRPAAEMTSPDGKTGYIPRDNVPAAMQSGFKPTPSQVKEPGFWENLGHTFGIGQQEGQAQQQQLQQHPIQSILEMAAGPGYQVVKGLAGGFMRSTGELGQSVDALRGGNAPEASLHAISAVPILGPAVIKMAQEAPATTPGQSYLSQVASAATPGNIGTAVGTSAQIAPLALGAADNVAPGRPTVGGSPPPIPGQNYTPTQLKAHAGLISRSTGLGDNFIPQQAAADTGSIIRQTAANNPAIAKVAVKGGSTPVNIAAFQNILQKANTALEAPHAATIAQYADAPADLSSVQSAVTSSLPKTLAGVAPEDVSALQQLSDRLGTVKTMGGFNDLRRWLNNEASSSYIKDSISANRSSTVNGAYRTAADAARNAYFDQLQNHSGIDFQPIKSQQSALMSQQEGLAGVAQKLSSQQAIADEPKSLQQVLSDALTGGRALKAGPVAGTAQLVAEKVLRRTPLTQPNYLIRKTLSDLPPPTPQPSVTRLLTGGSQ